MAFNPERPGQIEEGPWSEPFKMTPEEQRRALEWLKKAAEQGIVVEGKGEGESDLDGNMAIALLRRAGIVTTNKQVHYVGHEKLPEFLEKNPQVGVMLDISPEIAAGMETTQHREHRDSLASSLTPHGGRVYFEHHGPASTPRSGSTTKKVYRWLLAIGAITKENAKREGWDQIVDFVDAQDNKNYYTPSFAIEHTATNAFGLLQAPLMDARGKIHPQGFLGRYDPREGRYSDVLIQLIKLTGGDPLKQLKPSQLKAAGIAQPEKLVEKVRDYMAGAGRLIAELRGAGKIVKTTGEGEIFIDVRRPDEKNPRRLSAGALQYKHVDPSDALMSAGVQTHLICGTDPTGGAASLTIFTHNRQMLERLRHLAEEIGGDVTREGIYNYRHALHGKDKGAPQRKQVLEQLGVKEAVAREQNIRQSKDKSCVLASLRNLERHLFGYSKADTEEDLIQKATDKGMWNERAGITRKSAKALLEKLGYTVFTRKDISRIWEELLNDKGLIVFRNGHAIAIHYDKKMGGFVVRDPKHEQPEIYDGKQALPEVLAEVVGVNKYDKKGGNPYGHVLIIGRIESQPVTGEGETISTAIAYRQAAERRSEENEGLTLEERVTRILSQYRPEVVMACLQHTVNRLQDKNYKWQVEKVVERAQGIQEETRITKELAERRALNELESRLLAEKLVFTEQDALIHKEEARYLELLRENIKTLDAKPAYTKQQRKDRKSSLELLQTWEEIIASSPVRKPEELTEMRIELYLLRPDILAGELEADKQLLGEPRLRALRESVDKAWEEWGRLGSYFDKTDPALVALRRKLNEYGKIVGDRLPQMIEEITYTPTLSREQIKSALELEVLQAKLYDETVSVYALVMLKAQHRRIVMPELESWSFASDDSSSLERLQLIYNGLRADIRPEMEYVIRYHPRYREIATDMLRGEGIPEYVIRKLTDIARRRAA